MTLSAVLIGVGCGTAVSAQELAVNFSRARQIVVPLDDLERGAPQLSLLEIERLAGLLDGKRVHSATTLIVTTSPEIKFAADRMGLTRRIEDAGGIVAAGICFYQSYAREMAEANGWQRLVTNSAKLVNILAGYGYKPTLASMARCIDSAVAGKVL